MNKTSLILSCTLFFAGAACSDGDPGDDLLVENSTFIAALTEGEGEELGDANVEDPEGAAEESAEESASEEVQLSRDCSLAGLRRGVIATYDSDEDGRLSEEERGELMTDFSPRPQRIRRAARHHLLQRLRWIYDADENGLLDEAERQELRNDLEMRCENRKADFLERFDADENGELDDAEWEAAREDIIARRQAHREEILSRHDDNGDGFLSLEERADLIQERRDFFQTQREALLERFDYDGSGDLDANERDAVREELKARVRGEHFAER